MNNFHKFVVANWFMAILCGGEMNINQLHHQILLSCFRFASSVYISLDLIITIVSFQLLLPVILYIKRQHSGNSNSGSITVWDHLLSRCPAKFMHEGFILSPYLI